MSAPRSVSSGRPDAGKHLICRVGDARYVLRGRGRPPIEPAHGTWARYFSRMWRCRCADCCAAQRAYDAARRARRQLATCPACGYRCGPAGHPNCNPEHVAPIVRRVVARDFTRKDVA